ncbi:MAG: outer membrane beta-barrel protein [Bdellovibrionales bacterium]
MSMFSLSAPVHCRSAFATIVASSFSLALATHPVAAADSGLLSDDVPGGTTLQAMISETGSWESNPLLLFQDAKPLYGSITTPVLILTSKTPTSQLGVDTRVNENLFNQSSFNSTDVHQKINLAHQTEQWGIAFEQHTDYDTTRTSELLPTGVGGVSVNRGVRHLGVSFAPKLVYTPNATNQFALDGSIANSQYDDAIFSDYLTASVTPSYTHKFDPRNAGILSLQTQRYMSTTGPDVTVDNIGPSVGWVAALSPELTAKVAGGMQATRQYGSGAVQKSWSPQYTYSASLTYKDEQDNALLSAERTNYPFGNASEALLTTLSAKDTHQLNELFSVNFGASYQSADFQSTANGSLDYLINGNGGLAYHMTDELDLAGTYQYRYETLNGVSGNAQDHKITIGVVYHPRAWSL